MNIELRYSLILLLVILNLLAPNVLAMGNIDPTDKYAWSFTSAWINFSPSYGGVTVYSDHLEGYAWSEQSGWIQLGSQGGGEPNYYTNTSSIDWGVNHDGAGHLSGYAWSKALGWINFNLTNNAVTIDQVSGDFKGYAWSEQGGWIRFQQSEAPGYKVRYSLIKAKPPLPTLTVSIDGSGLVRSVPDGIYCSEMGGDCQIQYDEGTVVALNPIATADYQFSHWEGSSSDCDDGQFVMTADISCLAHFQPVELPPPCQSMSITTLYKGEGEIIDCKEVIITESGSISQVIFTGQVENAGFISNSTITAGATVTGGTLTGTIKNEGTIANVNFIGVKLSGGKLVGIIQNSTQIGSIIADVELLPQTTLSGGLLSGQIQADSTSLIQDVQLKADSRLTGGQLDRIIQGDPAQIAQIMADEIRPTAQLSYVCLSPSVQLPPVLDNVIGEGVTFQIPQLNNQCLSKVDPSTFTVEQIEQFPPAAFLAMDAESLSKFSPAAIAALTTKQFQNLPPPALNGLTTKQLRALSVTVLDVISSPQLAAINRDKFQGLSDTEIGRTLVYLNADNISPAEVKALLPKGWDIDPSGALTAPVGTQLTLRDLPPANLPSNVTLPPQPDFQTSFALGGKGKTTTLANLNQILTVTNTDSYQNLTMSQNPQGIINVSGPSDRKNRYAFIGDKDRMLQVFDDGTLAGLKRDKGGFYLINTSEDQQYRLLPAPIDIIDLANLLTGGEVVLRESGEVLMTLPDKSVIVALFDPEVMPVTGSIKPRLQLPTTSQVKKRESEVGWVYYSDGTKQAFRPTVLSPPTFIDTGLKFDNQVESVNLVADGGFYVIYDQKPYVIVPRFEVKTEVGVKASEPTITYHDESATLEYTLVMANTDELATRSRQTRQTLFSFVAEVIPYECQIVEAGIMNQDFYCSIDKGILWQCQSEPYYGPLLVDDWLRGIDWWLGIPYCPPY